MNVQPSGARAAVIDAAIVSLKNAGVWTKLDVLWLLAAHDSQAGLLNWVSPSTLALTAQNAPTFATDKGYTGDGISSYLSSGFTPGFNSAQAIQDDNHLGIWVLTSVGATTQTDIGNDKYSIVPRTSTATVINVRDSSTTANSNTVPSGNSIGHTLANRTGGAGYDVYKNASNLVTATQASVAPGNTGGFAVLARNAAGTPAGFSTRQVAAAHAGKSLTAQNITDLYSALSTFLTALGN
jgi:hypothetical protein